MTVKINNISKSYDGIDIFTNINCKINKGDKVGLVGENGVGKSTLIKIILGYEKSDSGEISFAFSNMKIAYLSQDFDLKENINILKCIEKYEKQFNGSQQSSHYCNKVKKMLLQHGFMEADMDKDVSVLSGGEKTRLYICMLLCSDADFLIMDEPTNHLDSEGIKWLEEVINKLKKTILIVSHDREFLDNTADRIFEMSKDNIDAYSGNYSNYKKERDIRRKHLTKEKEKQDREIKNLERVINDRKNWYEKAHKAAGQSDVLRRKAKKHVSIMKAKEKQLEKIKDNRVEIPKDNFSAAFHIINKNFTKSKLPEYLIRVSNIKKKFGNKCLLCHVTFNLKREEKVGLLGKNGSGKSTLIKMILGMEDYVEGNININSSVRIGYFSQELKTLKKNNTILEEMLSTGVSENEARLMLGCLKFRREDVFKLIDNLSMGERGRVALGKLMISDINLLILDEPTNHMDIVSKECIENVLREYKGSILFVSHDRYFIREIADKILEIENQTIKTYDGDYKYYLDKKKNQKLEVKNSIEKVDLSQAIIKLEYELAFINGKLCDPALSNEEKDKLERKFFRLSQDIREKKNTII